MKKFAKFIPLILGIKYPNQKNRATDDSVIVFKKYLTVNQAINLEKEEWEKSQDNVTINKRAT